MTTLEEHITAHGAAVLSYAVRVTGDRHLAEDVVQETWLRAWRNLDRLTEDRGSVRAWLIRVTHNLAVDLHRSRRSRPEEVELVDHALEALTPVSTPCEEVETRMVVGAVLENLSARHRRAVVEVYFADRTASSAAVALGVPPGTVKSRVHNALRTLRETFPQPLAETA